MGTESELMRLLRSNPPAKKFVPYCYMSKESDTLTVYFEGDPDYSQRLNDHVTLYLSIDTKEIVGCRIKGINGILSDLPNYIRVEHDGVELSVIFWSFRGGATDDAVRQAINGLAREASERNMVLQTAI